MASSLDSLLLTDSYLFKMQKARLEIFKLQNLEKGHFDVIFEIEQKQLRAHKFILTSVSETMNAKFSERWATEEEVIKVENYSFESFHQFLLFLYSGDCQLTKENAVEMVDIAEFYGVLSLKDYCDQYMSTISNLSVENMEETFDFADKYSLPKFTAAIKEYIGQKGHEVLKAGNFSSFKKPFIEFLSVAIPVYHKSELFELTYKWAEDQALKQREVNDENFNLQEAAKNELITILPNFEFFKMSFHFLMNFVVEKGFLMTPSELAEFFMGTKNGYSNEDDERFKSVYRLAEKQALQKQKWTSEGTSFNISDSIKDDLAEIIPLVQFYKIEKAFVMNSIVGNGIFSEEEANRFYDTRVELKSGPKIISGIFNDAYGVRRAFQRAFSANDHRSRLVGKCRFFNVHIPIPSTPSTVKKMAGCEWYLCLENDGVLTVKNQKYVKTNDYLLSEMSSPDNHDFMPNILTHLTFSDNV